MPPAAHGPFHTAAEAKAAARPLREVLDDLDPAGTLSEHVRRARAEFKTRYVTDGLDTAHVGLGEHDLAVAAWLAGAPAETIVVVLDWIIRAGVAGNVELLAEAAEYIIPCPAPVDGRCKHGVWALCRRTDVAWLLRGLDPAEVRAHALKRPGSWT